MTPITINKREITITKEIKESQVNYILNTIHNSKEEKILEQDYTIYPNNKEEFIFITESNTYPKTTYTRIYKVL